MSRVFRYFLPLAAGGLLTLAYPGMNWEAMVWIWLLPLLAVIWPLKPTKGGPRPFLAGLLAGLAFWIPNLAWLRHSSRVIAGARDDAWIGWGPELLGAAAVVGLALYCALQFALWAWFVSFCARPEGKRLVQGTWQTVTAHSLACAFLAAAAWVALEWVRGVVLFSGFGWNGLGVALHQNPVLIQGADIVGVTGLSFLPVFTACTAWNMVSRLVRVYRGEGECKSRLDFTLAMILLLAVAGYGMLRLAEHEKGEQVTVRTVLIQPNVAQADVWSEAWGGELGLAMYERLGNLTRMYAQARDGVSHTDLVIWPESALPVHLYGLPDHVPYFNDLLAVGDFSLLTGTELYAPGEKGHVAAVLFHGGYENRQEYHKIHLVPFGEYLPLRSIPPFSFLQGVLPGDFAPGVRPDPFRLEKPAIEVIPLICFEDTVGRLARRFARPGPQMLVNITNDGWFLQSIETEVHLANAKFRCIELRRPMVRAANTGVSCFIDPYGREVSRLADPETGSTFIEGCLPGEVRVPKAGHMTFYARYGDAFSWAMFGITLIASGLHICTRRSDRVTQSVGT